MTASVIDGRARFAERRRQADERLDTMLRLGIVPGDTDGEIIVTPTGCQTANWQRMNADPRDGSDGPE